RTRARRTHSHRTAPMNLRRRAVNEVATPSGCAPATAATPPRVATTETERLPGQARPPPTGLAPSHSPDAVRHASPPALAPRSRRARLCGGGAHRRAALALRSARPCAGPRIDVAHT